MSTTEGLWSGKLFKIKMDGEDLIIGGERNMEIGWERKNKIMEIGNDNNERIESENRKGNNDKNQELGYGGNLEFEDERRDLRRESGVGETNWHGSESRTNKLDDDSNNNNKLS